MQSLVMKDQVIQSLTYLDALFHGRYFREPDYPAQIFLGDCRVQCAAPSQAVAVSATQYVAWVWGNMQYLQQGTANKIWMDFICKKL